MTRHRTVAPLEDCLTRHRGAWLALSLLAVAALAGCAGEEPPSGVANIPMLDNFYARDVTRVPVGGTVRFPNEGRVPHNAVALDGTWRTPESIGRGSRNSTPSARSSRGTGSSQ